MKTINKKRFGIKSVPVFAIALSIIITAASLVGFAGCSKPAPETVPEEKPEIMSKTDETSAAADPWVGLWRSASDEAIALYYMIDDGAYMMAGFWYDGSEDPIVVTGKYRVSGDEFVMYDWEYDGMKGDTEVAYYIEVEGDLMLLENILCERVPDEYIEAVLADPTGPYPPGVASPGQGLEQPRVSWRVELLALIFRLAGHDYFVIQESDLEGQSYEYADYHRSIAEEFDQYKDHPAVKYASTKLDMGGGDVLSFAVHIKEDFSGLIDNTGFLISDEGSDYYFWTEESAEEFFKLVVDFYYDTGFDEFYGSNTEFYKAQTAPFAQDARIAGIDPGWFAPFAKRQRLGNEFKAFVSPSCPANMRAMSEEANYVFLASGLGENPDFKPQLGIMLVYGFNRSFSGGAGIEFYLENEQFSKWVDGTKPELTDPGLDPTASAAAEYMASAFTILYFEELGDDEAAAFVLEGEKDLGFQYIEEVCEMLKEYKDGYANGAGVLDLTIIKNNKNDADAILAHGEEVKKFEDHVRTLKYFEAAIAEDASVAAYHSERGLALFMLERYAEAKEAVEEALSLDPNDGTALSLEDKLAAASLSARKRDVPKPTGKAKE